MSDMPARGVARSGECDGCCSHLRTRERRDGVHCATMAGEHHNICDCHAALVRRYYLFHLPFTNTTMGMSYRQYLYGDRIYGCSTCKTHLATIHSMMSRVRHPHQITPPHPTHLSRLSTDSTAEPISLKECKFFLLLTLSI